MGKLQFIKRAQFAPSVTAVCLIQADIYSSGRQKYAFLTFTNPEGIWHHEGIAKITPYNEDKKPLKPIGLRIDLTMIPPGGFFSYPEEIPLPVEAEDFNFEFLRIDGIQAPGEALVRAFADEEPGPKEPAALGGAAGLAAEAAAAPEPVRDTIAKGKNGKQGAKHIEIISFSHRRIRKPLLIGSVLAAVALGIGSSIFINNYPGGKVENPELTFNHWTYKGVDCYAISGSDPNYNYSQYTAPTTHLGEPVLIIENYAFRDCLKMTAADLRYIDYFCNNAFDGCTNLERVFISAAATVESNAFPSWTVVDRR